MLFCGRRIICGCRLVRHPRFQKGFVDIFNAKLTGRVGTFHGFIPEQGDAACQAMTILNMVTNHMQLKKQIRIDVVQDRFMDKLLPLIFR